jgi:lysylphosphatidylglycerol synthetase-like protein (DUF2156 family)
LSGKRKAERRQRAERRRTADERPPAPWGSFPLSELTILAGIVMLAIGAFSSSTVALAIGFALASIGGLEVAAREHFAGFRSHTTLLAGFCFIIVVGVLLYAARLKLPVAFGAGAVVFLVVFYLLRRAFQRASGGLSFRAGGLRG